MITTKCPPHQWQTGEDAGYWNVFNGVTVSHTVFCSDCPARKEIKGGKNSTNIPGLGDATVRRKRSAK